MHRIINRLFSAVLILFIIFLFTSCSVKTNSDKLISTEILNHSDNVLRERDTKSEIVYDDTSLSLLYHNESGAISLLDKQSKKKWCSLPDFKNSSASNMCISVIYEGVFYYISSQEALSDNNKLKYDISDKVLTVYYEFCFLNKEITIPVTYKIINSSLEVSVVTNKIEMPDNVILASIDFLPYMGCCKYDENDFDIESIGDWFLVPDGSGATIFTCIEDDNLTEISYPVYFDKQNEKGIKVSLGAYGIKLLNNALAVVIADGEENAEIKVIRSNADKDGINRIFTSFIITPTKIIDNKIVYGNSFDGNLCVSYESLSDDSADYVGVAASIRQRLIEYGFMARDKKASEYPFYATLAGAFDGRKKTVVTNINQANNILEIIKAKGINDAKVILNGFLDDGICQKNINSINLSKYIGAQNQINEFYNYVSSQKFDLYLGLMLFSSFENKNNASKDILGNKQQYFIDNYLYPLYSNEKITFYSLTKNKVEKNLKNIVLQNSGYNNSHIGINIIDTGDVLTDFSTDASVYDDRNQLIVNSLSSIDSVFSTMLNAPNFNQLLFADCLNNIPMTTNIEQSSGYVAVPFLQTVLHSYYTYAGPICNSSEITVLSLLKSIEYGAVPHYYWCFSANSDKNYEITLNDAVKFYLKAQSTFSDLVNKAITDHFMYENGVYCTQYEGGAKVYVNYNNYSVIINEIAVLPYDYIRIG